MPQQNKSFRLIGLISIILLNLLIVFAVIFFNPFQNLQLSLSNLLYQPRPSNTPITIIAIDDQSQEESALGRYQLWPRNFMAKALSNLSEYQPKVVGLDIFYASKSQGIQPIILKQLLTQPGDLREALTPYYNIEGVHPSDQSLLESFNKTAKLVIVDPTIIQDQSKIFSNQQLEIANIPRGILDLFLEKSKILISHNFFPRDQSGIIRNFPGYLTFQNNNYIAFPLKTALEYMGLDEPLSINLSSNLLSIKFSNRSVEIPLDSFLIQVNYSNKSPKSNDDINKLNNIKVISFIDLYRNDGENQHFFEQALKDKIVLIGAWSNSLNDRFSTPISPTDPMPGVLIHAQAIQTILDQAWLRNFSQIELALTLLIFLGLTFLVTFKLKLRYALPLIAALNLIYLLVLAPLMFQKLGIIANLIYPPLAAIMALISSYSYRYFAENKQKTAVAGALGQYVNQSVAQNVLNNGQSASQIKGEKREISVIFTDIKSFTSISENLQPQSLVTLLNEYFQVMSEIISRNGGTIDKFEGDAIMCFFGAPEIQTDHAHRAAQTALEMRAALPALLKKWSTDPLLPGGEKKPAIDFRVGVSSGEAIIGNIGSSHKIEYTAIGDIVNLGSRLESANKKYQTHILISGKTYEAIQTEYQCRFADRIRVKGKTEAINIYELLSPAGQLPADQTELITAYNQAIQLYFEKKFIDCLQLIEKEIYPKWPQDLLSNIFAARCELYKRFPPSADWDGVYTMESK